MSAEHKQVISLLHAFGLRLYDLQAAVATIFELNKHHNVFTFQEFMDWKAAVEQAPDLKAFRAMLDRLVAKEDVDLEALLRDFQGPIQ